MATHYLLPKDGSFYKANLHCHSTFSDGTLTVEQIKEAYKSRGYSIIGYSDHNVLAPHRELEDENFLPVTAIEIDFNAVPDERSPKGWPQVPVYHINFYSKDPDRKEFIPFERVYDFNNVQKIINEANEAGFLVQYNHPRWSYQTASDFERLSGLFAFEVFNYGCETEMHNGWAEYEYDHYMRRGGRAAAVATDDNHLICRDFESPYSDCFGGFTMIKAPKLTYSDILGAMERKDCYASTGAEIKALWITDDEDGRPVNIHIECSPCCSVVALTDSRTTRLVKSKSDDITVLDYALPGGLRLLSYRMYEFKSRESAFKSVFQG